MRRITECVAVPACSLFTGASVYISLVESAAVIDMRTLLAGLDALGSEFPKWTGMA